jgi:hypothetical protein
VKTVQNSSRSKASNAVLLTQSRAVRGLKSFRGLEACNLVTAGSSYCNLRQNSQLDSRSRSPDSNRTPPEYISDVLLHSEYAWRMAKYKVLELVSFGTYSRSQMFAVYDRWKSVWGTA